MNTQATNNSASRGTGWNLASAMAGVLLVATGVAMNIGCASDEPVGHTKTIEKRTVDTPTEKTTTTEVHEKDTKIIR